MEKYIHKKLELDSHIRVLNLHLSKDPSAPLRCSIKQQELGPTAEQYECISYTWGGQVLDHILRCDDGAVVEITANLHAALSRFRSNSHPRFLWADAVCINQADPEEKSRQIPLMPRIYRNASSVLVWLGSGMDGESETMQSLAGLTKLPDRFPFPSRQGQEIAEKLESQSPEAQESIRRFFQLPWFSRRWIVQEAVSNPDVVFHCGLSEISWPRLHLAIECLPDCTWNGVSGRQVRTSLQKLGDLWRTWSYLDQTTTNCELFNLLDSFHHFECKEDKDRIYALAGLASDVQTSNDLMPLTAYQGKMLLVPDYSLSDEEVFRQVALQRMQSGRVFTTLAYAGALRPRNGPRALSSWVPDFRLSKLWRPIPEKRHPACQPTIELLPDGSLALRGEVRTPYRFSFSTENYWNSCKVHSVFPAPTDSEPRHMLQYLRDCLHWMHSLPTLVELEKDVQETALCDILLAFAGKLGKEEYEMDDSMPDLMPGKSKSSSDTLDPAYLKSLIENEDSESEYPEKIIPYTSTIFKALTGRCLFMSNTVTVSRRFGEEDFGGWQHFGISLLGIGPGDIVAGDVIARFAGVEQSLFFRPQDGRYQVLGDGYFVVLPPTLRAEFHSSRAEIVLV